MPNRSSGSVKVFYPRASRDDILAWLRARLPALGEQLPLTRVVLFGSWATGRNTAFSDVDLLVVYADPPRVDAYKLVRRGLDLRGLEPHVYAESEAASLGPTIERMTRTSIALL
jgi:uncharacterized protein